MASKALAVRDATELSTAAEQVKTLVRVLEPNAEWLGRKLIKAEDRPKAEAALVAVRELKDTAEKGRKMLTKPLLDKKREIDAIYETFGTAATGIDKHLCGLISASRDVERAAMVKAAEKEAKTLERKGAAQAAEDVRALAAQGPALATLQEQTIIRAEVEDKEALVKALLAAGLLDVIEFSQTKLNALVKAGMKLPGLRRAESTIVKRGA